jgi:hypothetical protein
MSKALNPLLMIGVLIVGFIGALAVSYFIMPSVAPEYTALPPEPIKEEIPQNQEFEKYNYLAYGPSIVQRLEKRADSLANIVEFRRETRLRFINDITKLQAEVDSLKRLNATKDEIIFQLENQSDSISSAALEELMAAKNQKVSQQVRDIAATMSRIDEEQLGEILNLLTTEELSQLYEATAENRRNRIINALSKDKAAELIRYMYSAN